MKFRVTLKDPDGPYDSMKEAAKDSIAEVEGIDEDEREVLVEEREERLREFAGKWLKYGEYVTLEFDTDAGTCVAIKAN